MSYDKLGIGKLQLGHDEGVVEGWAIGTMNSAGCTGFNWATTKESWKASRLRDTHAALLEGFNWATTKESWKATWLDSVARRYGKLQLGHDEGVVEGLEVAPLLDAASKRFNWATTKESWKARRSGRQEARISSFNWATTKESWKAPVSCITRTS